MFRVGILGAENSHATAFTTAFNCSDLPEFEGIRVVGVGGNYPEENKKVFELGKMDILAAKPEDLLGKIDALMVTARDGKFHADFARPFIEAGIPTFIDKPFTSDPEEALELVKLAKSKGVPLTGGSLLKIVDDVQELRAYALEHDGEVLGANFTAPVNMVNEYGDFWFYSAHLVEMNIRVFGMPQWVWADKTNSGVTGIAHYENFDVTMHYTQGAAFYSGTINTTKGTFFKNVELTDGYLMECRGFAKMLRTGEMEFSYEDLVKPVYYLAAIKKSFETGEKQYIPEIKL